MKSQRDFLLKWPDLLKVYCTLLRTVLNFGPAWRADVCHTRHKKYSNKPAKGYEGIIGRF